VRYGLPLNLAFLKIAFRNIPRRRSRNALTCLAIIVGVSLFVGATIGFDNIFQQFEGIITQAVGTVDITVRQSLELPFDRTVLETVTEITNIENASPRIIIPGKIWNGSAWRSTTLVGLDATTDFDYLDPSEVEITGIRYLGENSSDAVIDMQFDIALGETVQINVTLFTNNTFDTVTRNLTSVGMYHPRETFSGLGQSNSTLGTIFLDLATMQHLLDYEENVTSIIIQLRDAELTEETVDHLNEALGLDYVVTPVKQSVIQEMGQATMGLQSGLSMMSWIALWVTAIIVLAVVHMNVKERIWEIGILRSQGTSKFQIFWMFLSESILLGAVGSGIGLILGIFLSPFFSQSITFASVLGTSAPIADTFHIEPRHLIIGGSSGILTGIFGSLWPALSATRTTVIEAMRPEMRKPGKEYTALKLIALGLPISLIAPFIPAIHTYGETIGNGLYIMFALAPLMIIGICSMTAGLLRVADRIMELLLFGWGSTKKIIARNVDRDLWRTGLTFAMIGLSFSLPIVLSASQTITLDGTEAIIQSFSVSDVIVTTNELVEKTFANNLTKLDNGTLIRRTTPTLVVPTKTILLNNMTGEEIKSSTTVLAIEPETYTKVMSDQSFSADSPTDAFLRLHANGTVLTEPLATSLDIGVGDTVRLRYTNYSTILIPIITPNGTIFQQQTVPVLAWANFTVIGIIEGAFMEQFAFGGFSLAETCYITYKGLNETFPQFNDNATMFFLDAKTNQDLKQIEQRIQQNFGTEYEMIIITNRDVLAQVEDLMTEMFVTFDIITIFAVVNSALGVLAIMIMNISERKREIGILRSQGTSRTQILQSVLGEALIIGAIGFFVAVALGLIFELITLSFMVFQGFPAHAFVVPIQDLQLTILYAAGVSVIGSLFPGWHAARVNVVEALRYT
jgi:putative ABC transport system permease protein